MTDDRQMALFDALPTSKHPLAVKFWEWHSANPHVYELFKRYALQAALAGRHRFSARTITERIRWHTQIDTAGDEYKINDHWTPFYARLFVVDHPKHRRLFQFRDAIANDITTTEEGSTT
jgi:hypothetical protein